MKSINIYSQVQTPAKQFLLFSFVFIMSLFSINNNALAQEKVFQKSALKVKSGDTKFISLGKGYHIDRIAFEAKGSVFGSDCELRLTIDGYQHVTVKIDKSGWRTYTASFSDFTKMVEVQNLSKSGAVKVRKIKILPRRIQSGGGAPYDHISTGSDAYYQVAFLKNTVDYLYHVVDQADRSKYLDGFVVVLGNALATLETSSELSIDARNSVESVLASLAGMSDFIDSLMQTPNLSETAREVKSTQRSLERMVNH